MDHEQEELSKLEFLKSFDSNIEIQDVLNTFSKERVQLLIDRRLKDMDSECLDDILEKTRAYNLLSFFHFAVNKQDEALSYNNQAREIDDRNINALVCLAYYQLQWKDFFECDKVCKQLHDLEPTEQEKLFARAEVAYTYTKIGIIYFQKAVDKFQEILTNKIEIPDNYICSWKFSMALAIRRQLNISNCPSTTDYPAAETHFRKVEMIYKDIISMPGDSVNRFKARACVDLGLEICYRNEQIQQQTSTDIESCESRKYIEQALSLEPDDSFVLSRSGKYFRLIEQPTQSIVLLTKALQKKETSFAHHHLALALRDQIYLRTGGNDETTDRTGHSRLETLSVVCKDDQRTSEDVHICEHNTYSTLLDTSDSQPSKVTGELAVTTTTPTSLPRRGRNNSIEIKHIHTYSPGDCYMNKLINSPLRLPNFPRGSTDEICQHLDDAFRLNNNIEALYDKGLILRSSRQYAEAETVFKTIFRNDRCSSLQLANAYEQAALCLLERAESVPSEQEKNEHNATKYLIRSIGFFSDIVARISDLEGYWQSFPTLRSLLMSKAHPKQELTDLALLYKKFKKYNKALSIFQTILQLEEGESERKEVMMKIVDTNVQLERYDDAIVVLNMILCLPNGNEKIDKTLYVRAHIKGGIAAWHKDETALAQKYLRDAVNTGDSWKNSAKESRTNGEMSYDIFLVSSEDSETNARRVSYLLKHFGLKVTLNSDDVMPGQPELYMMQTIKDKSEYIVVFLDEDTKDIDIQKMHIMCTDNTCKSIITISESKRAARDPVYRKLPSVSFERDMFSSVKDITEEHISWIEAFLFKLTGVPQRD